MKTMLVPALLLALGGLLLPGCISHEETVYRDTTRVKVEFENDAAARLFYETLSRAPDHHSRTESKTEVSIPVVFDHKQKVVDGTSRKFNEAVAICDSNKDGRITELEAKIYAEQKYWK